jgi:anti-sigma B factor antagonist
MASRTSPRTGRSPVTTQLGHTATREPLVVFSGEIDDDRHGIIDHSITDAAHGATTVHLDLSGVEFMGSAGLEVLVRSARALEAQGKRLTIDRTFSIVRRVLEVTFLADFFGLPPGDGTQGHQDAGAGARSVASAGRADGPAAGRGGTSTP